MRILMVSVNRTRLPMPVVPFGACIVSDAARNAGYDVRFLDFMFAPNRFKLLRRELSGRPDVVAVSLRNIDNNDMKNPEVFFKEAATIVKEARRDQGARIVLGGAACAVMPEALLRYSGADYVISGAGERSFPKLLKAIEMRESPSGIPGAGWIDNGVFNFSGPARENYSSASAPDLDKWLDLGRYKKYQVPMPIQTKRGCPYGCIYCTYPFSEGKQFRLAEPGSVISAIKKYEAMGVSDIEFVDSVFNAPYDYASEILKRMISSGVRARFHTLELNPRYVDDRFIALMKEANFRSIGVTAESASGTVLKNLGKEYSTEHVGRAAEAINNHDIPCMWMFMLGGPGETRQTLEETFSFACGHIKKSDTVLYNAGIRIYPGTGIERIARQEGVLSGGTDEMLSPVSYFSPEIDRDWFEKEMRALTREHANFIDSRSLSLSFLPILYRISGSLGLRYPFWRFTGKARSVLNAAGVIT